MAVARVTSCIECGAGTGNPVAACGAVCDDCVNEGLVEPCEACGDIASLTVIDGEALCDDCAGRSW